MTMRSFLLAATLAALPLAAPAAAPRPWTAVASVTPGGSFVIGNPKARVKLVEYVSYTCPHCAHFTAEAAPTLNAMVRSGSTSIELRNQIHDRVDLAAATLAQCAGPRVFPTLHEALFTRQQEWIARAVAWDEANAGQVADQPQLTQLRAIADGAGLSELARGAGMPPAAVAACFATDAALRRTLAVSAKTGQVRGTPAFEINGRLVQGIGWAELQPMLRAAGAK